MTEPTPQPPDVAPNDRQISVRLPLDLFARLDGLAERMERDPRYAALGVSRNGLIKLLLLAGLDELEKEFPPDSDDDAEGGAS